MINQHSKHGTHAIRFSFFLFALVMFGLGLGLSLHRFQTVQDALQQDTLFSAAPEEDVSTLPVLTDTSDLSPFFSVMIAGDASLAQSDLQTIRNVLAILPADHVGAPERLFLRYDDPSAPRGLGGRTSVILRPLDLPKAEMISLLLHELGHTVDLGLIDGSSERFSEFADGLRPVRVDDRSLQFYNLCWAENTVQNGLCADEDFVSGYAQTDPFEDFAESYLFYVLHGKEFRILKNESTILAKKYDYLYEIFHGTEYATGSAESLINGQVWDSTRLPLDAGVLALVKS